MGNLWYQNGEKRDVRQVIAELLKEDVTYEFIANVVQCPLETVKDVAASIKK